MADIIKLERKAEPEPDEYNEVQSGEAQCLECKHRWQVVRMPLGIRAFECPSCGTNKGVLRNLFSRLERDFWQCHCGNDLFRLHDTGPPMCVLCGCLAQDWVEEG